MKNITDADFEKPLVYTMYTQEQIAKHNTITDCWVSIDDKVYDLTEFISLHPGGGDIIMKVAGQDATLMFHQFGHSEYARNIMNRYCIGELDGNKIMPLSIAKYRKQIEEEDLIRISKSFLQKYYVYNRLPVMILYKCILASLLGSFIQYKKQSLKNFLLSYFIAQIVFMIGHTVTHQSFIHKNDKTRYSGFHIAYTHHYVSPYFMPKYSFNHRHRALAPKALIMFTIPYFLIFLKEREYKNLLQLFICFIGSSVLTFHTIFFEGSCINLFIIRQISENPTHLLHMIYSFLNIIPQFPFS